MLIWNRINVLSIILALLECEVLNIKRKYERKKERKKEKKKRKKKERIREKKNGGKKDRQTRLCSAGKK